MAVIHLLTKRKSLLYVFAKMSLKRFFFHLLAYCVTIMFVYIFFIFDSFDSDYFMIYEETSSLYVAET